MLSPRRLVFWLCVILQGVNALNAAGPYEMVYLYYAYKMEFATAAGPRKIAPGCPHIPFTGYAGAPLAVVDAATTAASLAQGVPGICTFYEFYRWVGSRSWAQAMTNKDNVAARDPASINNPLTRTIDPDPDRLAIAVNDPGTIGNRRLATETDRLWSAAAIAGMQAQDGLGWARQLKTASDVVETARQDIANRLLANPDNAAVQGLANRLQTWVDKAILNLSTVHHYRSGDFARYLVPAQKGHVSWTSSPMSTAGVVDTPGYTRIDGGASALIRNIGDPPVQVIEHTFEVVNWQESFDLARSVGIPVTAEQRQALKLFSLNYGTIAGTIEKSHRDIMDVVKFARDLHRKLLTFEAVGEFFSCHV